MGKDASVDNPVAIDVRVAGTGDPSTDADAICNDAQLNVLPDKVKTFKGFGLFTVPFPAGAANCVVVVAAQGSRGAFTFQIYVQTSGAAPTPTTTTPTPTTPAPRSHPFDGNWQGTFTGVLSATPNDAAYGSPKRVVLSIPVTADVSSSFFGGACGEDSDKNQFCVYTPDGGIADVQIPSDGLVTGLTTSLDVTGVAGFTGQGCDFSIQFSGSTAKSTPIACQFNTDPTFPTGTAVSLTDARLQLTRTSK